MYCLSKFRLFFLLLCESVAPRLFLVERAARVGKWGESNIGLWAQFNSIFPIQFNFVFTSLTIGGIGLYGLNSLYLEEIKKVLLFWPKVLGEY